MGHWIPIGSISHETSVVIHQILAKLWTTRQFLENPDAHIEFFNKYPHLLQASTTIETTETEGDEDEYAGEQTEDEDTLRSINELDDEGA